MPDNRKFSRVGFNIDCRYKTPAGEILCRVLNLSLKGVLVEIKEKLSPKKDKNGIIEIKLYNSDITISFVAELVHQKGKQAGFRFVKTDSDSITHLRSILEANTGNPDLIDKELHSMIEN